MNWAPSGYARTIGGLVAALAATGSIGYYSANGISGGGSSSNSARAVATTSLEAAAIGGNGADYGFSGYCGVERHDVKDLLDGELFGREAAAFGKAHARRIGCF